MWANNRPNGSTSTNKDNGYVFEQQNDVRMHELGSKLSVLKNITLEMQQDVEDQDRLLNESQNAFGGLGDNLQNSFGRLNRMVSTRHKRQMCFYVGIALAVFTLFYVGSSLTSWMPSTPAENPVDSGEQDI
ncbi:hypothetical protein F4703DRAFT_1882191 [Phycomyces blakesleeanus]